MNASQALSYGSWQNMQEGILDALVTYPNNSHKLLTEGVVIDLPVIVVLIF